MNGQKIHRSKMLAVEWIILLTFAVSTDILDFILLLAGGLGVLVNRIDIVLGLGIAFYLFIRGEFSNPKTRNRALGAIVVAYGLEALVPVLDIAPFWTVDILYCWSLARQTNKIAKQEEITIAETKREDALQAQQEQMMLVMERNERQGIEIDTDNEMRRELIKKNLTLRERRKQQLSKNSPSTKVVQR